MNKNWIITNLKKVKVKNPILIEGLPGMGNVGKITVDFIIETLDAEKIYEINSYNFPNCVFVNDKGIAELPKVEIYYKKIKKNDFLFVSGDVQPIDEEGSYIFCENLLELLESIGKGSIVTLGGIGLEDLPKKPKVYSTFTDENVMQVFKKEGVKPAIGIVGPVIGVSGILIGLAKKKNIKAICLLVETIGHPTYFGIKEARELLRILNNVYKLGLNMKELDKEVKLIEKEIKEKVEKMLTLKEDKMTVGKKDVTNYIG